MAKQDPETELANCIRKKLWELRDRLRNKPDASPLLWLKKSCFVCSQRPLRDHPDFGGSGKTLPAKAGPDVITWAKRVSCEGIKSVICLMHPKELKYYESLDDMQDGLLKLYKRVGFKVRHIAWADPAHEKTEKAREALRNRVTEIKKEAYKAYCRMPKPVLLHCSAGIDRSAPVAAYILLQEKLQS